MTWSRSRPKVVMEMTVAPPDIIPPGGEPQLLERRRIASALHQIDTHLYVQRSRPHGWRNEALIDVCLEIRAALVRGQS